MVQRRACAGLRADGQRCRAYPLTDGDFCLLHSPDHIEEAQEARRLGGQRRRRERVVASAYDIDGLSTVSGIQRLVDIAAIDTLNLENSVSRNRTLTYIAQIATKLLEVGQLEERLEQLERQAGIRRIS